MQNRGIMQGQSGPGDEISIRGVANIGGFAAVSYATCVTPCLRGNFGCEALGFQGLFACIALLLLAGADRVGLAYLLLWLVALAISAAIVAPLCTSTDDPKVS